MVLVDTSVWINHLRLKNDYLSLLLNEEKVLTHSSATGELACGSIKNRKEFLGLLENLPKSNESTSTEVLSFISTKCLFEKGIGWVDAGLLESTMISGSLLCTVDQRLRAIAMSLKISFSPLRG